MCSSYTLGMLKPIILCGGSGTRLWPLSRKSYPKQFVELFDGQSLLSLTLARLMALPNASQARQQDSDSQVENQTMPVCCVASEDHRFLIAEEMRKEGVTGQIILEPSAKNTAAAMALAALSSAAEDELLFCPADHYIPNIHDFANTVEKGRPLAAEGAIVLFGIQPSFAATGYGYIETQGGEVARFTEKPDLEKAEAMIRTGRFFWNSGIFLCRADTLLAALNRHAPDILKACQQAMVSSQTETFLGLSFIRPNANAFGQVRSQSIDYAVMEKQAGLKLVPFEGDWSDVGSWSAVASLIPSDADGNQRVGQAVCIDSKNTMLYGQDRVVVSVGVENLVVVDTPDALLVAAKDRSEDVKQVVAALETKQWPVSSSHRKVHRPWGWYDSVDRGERFQVKRIMVKPGASLSLQMHNHRAEHWVVVKGTAQVTRGEETLLLSENESVYIPIGITHRLENPGCINLEIIEIQSGSYLGEDDIVRLEDHYGRS